MTNAEIGEKVLNEMYTFIMSGMSAATAALEGKMGIVFTVWMGGVDGAKDIAIHPGENHYQAVGRTVGNMISVVTSLGTGNLVKNATLKTKAVTAFGVTESLAKISLGDTFSNLFNTYVANADAFYSKILSDVKYANTIWDGIKKNGLNNFVNYFDPDGDGNVSPTDIVNGYKKLFSPPPAFGTPEFVALYSPSEKTSIIIQAHNDALKTEVVKTIVQSKDIKQIQLNNVTFNITQANNLTVRNALDDIPAVSLLLTHILIKPGEKLDLGDKGIYTVKSGDTLSQIAEANGFNTKELLKKNTWLIDDGRVTFDQNKVLIETDASDLANQDHTLIGDTNASNILKDHNGGNDTLIGGNKADTLEGGEGYDTYITADGDTITDSDSKGRVFFNGNLLRGGKWDKDEGVYKGDGGKYIQTSNGWKFISDSGEVLNFNLDIKNSLGIKLKKDDDKPDDDSDSGDTHNNNNEDFSSPLILDLNHDNKLSTSLFNSNRYFDMDGDGFKERTAWMQEGDGLLALDKNSNAKIDNGNELFGNFTNLKESKTYFDLTRDDKDMLHCVSKYNKTNKNIKTLKNNFNYKNTFDTINKKEYIKYISKIA